MITNLKKFVPIPVKDFIKSLVNTKDRENSVPENWHVKFVRELANLMKIQVYAELGIYKGETFNAINAPTKIAVDIDQKYLSYAEDSLIVKKLLGDSKVLANYLFENSIIIDLLFIDANHSRQAVIDDFKNLEFFVAPNGIVLMHDTFPKSLLYSSQEYCGDAYLAVDELAKIFTNWSFATIPVHPGLTLATRLPNRPKWLLSPDSN